MLSAQPLTCSVHTKTRTHNTSQPKNSVWNSGSCWPSATASPFQLQANQKGSPSLRSNLTSHLRNPPMHTLRLYLAADNNTLAQFDWKLNAERNTSLLPCSSHTQRGIHGHQCVYCKQRTCRNMGTARF